MILEYEFRDHATRLLLAEVASGFKIEEKGMLFNDFDDKWTKSRGCSRQ